MAPDTGELGNDFARLRPDDFARVLRQGQPDEIRAVLRALPAELPVGVLARLPVELLLTLLESEHERLPEWLEAASFDAVTRLLGRLAPPRALALANAVDDRQARRRLLQHLNYPPHTLGSLVARPLLTFSTATPLDEVLSLLRDTELRDESAVVVLDADSRFAGMLDPWRLLGRGSAAATAGEFVRAVPILRPETSAVNALADPGWNDHLHLPVIDHERRLLGVITYAVLQDAVAGNRLGQEGRIAAELVESFARACGGLLERLLNVRSNP